MLDIVFSVPVMLSPCAVAAVVVMMYYVYPRPLVQGYQLFGGYLLAGLKRKFLTLDNGLSYCYYDRPALASDPEAANTVLFLHGFTSDKTMWTLVSKYLPKEWRVVVVDLPGHGESGFTPNCDYTAQGFAEKLHHFIEALDLRNIHIVGVSLGALISGTYVALHPKSIRSLTLMCPPGAHRLPSGVKTEFFEALETKGKNLILPEDLEGFQRMVELVFYNHKSFTFHANMIGTMLEIQKQNYPNFRQIQRSLLKSGGEGEIVELCSKIDVPTLIMWGQQDKVCDSSGATAMGKLIRNSEVVVIDKCGHVIPMDRPWKCTYLLSDFIMRQTVKS